MGAGLGFPEVFVGVSSADPADPNTVDVWTDLAVRTWRIRQAQAGRQYELGQSVAGRMSAEFRNIDEYLNPANTTSPLYAYAKPWRQTRFMGSYPNGSLGNMWNSLNGRDGSFETGLTGVLPSWLAAVGATVPTVQAANPHGGTRSLQYTVAGTTVPQGVATTPYETLPGRVHTAFGFVRQSAGSTQQIAVGGLTAADRYNRTGALSGSTADQGGTWSISGGVSGDYTTTAATIPQTSGSAAISNGSVNVARYAALGVTAQDYDLRCWMSVPVVAVGASIVAGLVGNFTDANNHYRYHLVFNTDGTVDVAIQKDVAATVTTLVTTTKADIYAAGSRFWIRAQKTGTTLNLKIWRYGLVEPAAWTATTTDAAIAAAQAVGLRSILTTGNTNTSPVVTYGPLAVTSYTTPGQTTATVGAYVQLAVTFTATQPYHYVQWATVGTAIAGTVNLDDLQCNRGNTAQAVTTSGPLVRGIWGGHVERLPITWVRGTNGYEGTVAAPCVGDLAAQARTKILTDAATAYLALNPALFYPLWDGADTTGYADVSGNNGSTLIVGSNGTPPGSVVGGSSTKVLGDPGGAGAAFAPNTPVSSLGSCLYTPNYGVVPLGSNTPPYGASVACWILPASGAQGAGYPVAIWDSTGNRALFQMFLENSDLTAETFVQTLSAPGVGVQATIFKSYELDHNPHHFAATLSVDATNTTITLYVDGVAVATSTTNTATSFGTSTPDLRCGRVFVGGMALDSIPPTSQGLIYASTISLVGIWNRTLSSGEIAGLYTAGAGNLGESSGARAQRMLSSFHRAPPAVVDLGTMSKMGQPSASRGTTLAAAMQRIQDTEGGNYFENRDGAPQFDGREIRYLRTAPTVVFGENVGAGQIPYTEVGAGPPTFDYDTTQMYNVAAITRTGGVRIIASGDTTGSGLTYYQNQYDLSVDCQTDAEAIDHGYWVTANFQQPKLRVRTLTVDLGAIPSLFPQIMNLEKGVRATVVRVAKAGNGGAGVTMSNDYFIENISHHDMDPEAGSWLVDLQMSPAPLQPWILGDTTYSVLGSTTVLGF